MTQLTAPTGTTVNTPLLPSSSSKSPAAAQHHVVVVTRPPKRPRLTNVLPAWERRLRYAAFRNLAETCLARGEFADALSAFSTALDQDQSDFLVWCQAARAATSSGQLHVARRAFETALAMRPGHLLPTRPYRSLLVAIGDPDDDVTRTKLCPDAIRMARVHAGALTREGGRGTNGDGADNTASSKSMSELLHIPELTWVALVDALRKCLERRMNAHGDVFIGQSVRFSAPVLPPKVDCALAESSDEVVVVAETRMQKRKIGELEPELVEVATVQPARTNELKSHSHAMTGHRIDTTNGNVSGFGIDDDDVVMVERRMSAPAAIQHSVEVAEVTVVESTANGGNGSGNGGGAHGVPQASRPDAIDVRFTEVVEQVKKPEVRRSARRAIATANANIELERRTTRTVAELTRSQQEDAQFIRVLLQTCHEKAAAGNQPRERAGPGNKRDGGQVKDKCTSNDPKTSGGIKRRPSEDMEHLQISPWKRVVEEREEAASVSECINSFERANSGPADLLIRVLSELSKIDVVQYFSTLALLWLTVRERLHLNVPGPPHVSVLIVEALLVSGKKASKQKARRFREAGRLLSQIRLSDTDQDRFILLSIRIAWLWGMFHDCRGEMQLSFQAAEHTLSFVEEIKGRFTKSVPALAGPELSGYSGSALGAVVQSRISRLKSARDLEKAEEELARNGAGDIEAAKRTVSILAPSVYATVKTLELDVWHENDLKFEFTSEAELNDWESRLDSEIELEPRLKVLSDACTASADIVGELVCFAVRLRMAVHYYAAKVRSENESVPHEKDNDSSSMRIADLLVQIRRFVMLVKKLSSSSSTTAFAQTSNPGLSGWTMEEAVTIVATTIVSLTELIMTKIPLAKHSPTATELGASQKNRRLGFTRCMLAFPRCILLLNRCQIVDDGASTSLGTPSDLELTRKMLFVTSFCLRALVARGCCREEGTSGALIKMYSKYLSTRLQQLAMTAVPDAAKQEKVRIDETGEANIAVASNDGDMDVGDMDVAPVGVASEVGGTAVVDQGSISSNHQLGRKGIHYSWSDVRVIRHELSQCFHCLYQIPELELVSRDETALDEVRWLEEGCRVSKHIGLAFVGSDPAGAVSAMDVDACRSIYFFYRKRIFEAVCVRRRDGGRVKRLRDVLSRLAEALPEDAPSGVSMLSFHALDTIVSDVVDSSTDIGREAAENVSKLEEEWNRVVEAGNEKGELSFGSSARNIQLSVMYFEVFSLHAMSILDAYETEYKKQKNAERRKRPKDIADRLLTASSECLIALRCRPWSVGAWILLGRIFVEISDLALDERELCFSSFGLYSTEDIASLGDGDSIQTNFGRAEACFGFAESLLRHCWAQKACSEAIPIDVSQVLGFAYDGSAGNSWNGFGDDGDLFGAFGLTNDTTSRPVLKGEPHPSDLDTSPDVFRLAAIRLGSSTLSILQLREMRYFHIHWTSRTLELRLLTQPSHQFPNEIVELASKALTQLTMGRNLLDGAQKPDDMVDVDSPSAFSLHTPRRAIARNHAEWRLGYSGLARMRWYYTLMEAKLMRKCGRPHNEYLPTFNKALLENWALRDKQELPRDIEPLYQLHASRMKLLLKVGEYADAMGVLTALERFSFKKQDPIVVDEVNDDDDWLRVRCLAIAEDIMSAMQSCTSTRCEVPWAEFFFKSTFCRAVLLAEIIKDEKAAQDELGKLFRLDAAAKVLDQGPDGVYRGYFYKLWNYRYTDTGVEPALETERKLVRWRSKLVGLYGQLLKQAGEWRLIAAIILRLKKRSSEDLPVDGAILDDLIEAYAVTRRESIISSMEKGILTDASTFEMSFRMTWDIYVESLRLSQGVRRVRIAVMRGEIGGTGEELVVGSKRPRCLASVHSVLRIEDLRLRAATEGIGVEVKNLRLLPAGVEMANVDAGTKLSFVHTLRGCAAKWPIDEKLTKVLSRRIGEFGGDSLDGRPGTSLGGADFGVGSANVGTGGSGVASVGNIVSGATDLEAAANATASAAAAVAGNKSSATAVNVSVSVGEGAGTATAKPPAVLTTSSDPRISDP